LLLSEIVANDCVRKRRMRIKDMSVQSTALLLPRGDGLETLYYSRYNSLAGTLLVAVSEKGMVALAFDRGQFPFPRDKNLKWELSEKKTKPYTKELAEYFSGKRRDFSFPLDLRGTPFQVSCWRALLKIPYGETRTYADIARAVGEPKGFRAVGLANNRNPIAIVVPCHRVIASDGTLCGYGGGLDLKRKLLELEGALTGTLAA
jgi:O-6-methylguanine DNA methyltransferase